MKKLDIEKRLEKYFNNQKPGITDKLHANGECMVFCNNYIILMLTQDIVPNTLLPLDSSSTIPEFLCDVFEQYSQQDLMSGGSYPVMITPSVMSVLAEFPDLDCILMCSPAEDKAIALFAVVESVTHFIGFIMPRILGATKAPRIPDITSKLKTQVDIELDIADLL